MLQRLLTTRSDVRRLMLPSPTSHPAEMPARSEQSTKRQGSSSSSFFSQTIAKFRLSRGCTGWSFFDLPVCFSDNARSVCSRLALLYFSVRRKRSRKPRQSVIISEEVPSKRRGRLTFLKSSDILDRVRGSSASDILQRDTFSAAPRCLQ